jgi:acyl-coenzyme A synthetase/AMP-(fatty) acid ligase
MVPEAMVSMLSVARIGAVHSMVFSGFGVGALAERIRDSGSRLVMKADIENAVARHPAIAEVAAVSVPDLVRGEVLAVFVTPKKDVSFEPQRLAEEVRELVRKEVGPVAVIGSVYVVDRLPRTRTGKIMRRVLRAVLAGSQPGDLSTLEDEASVEEVRAAVESLMRSMEGRERV